MSERLRYEPFASQFMHERCAIAIAVQCEDFSESDGAAASLPADDAIGGSDAYQAGAVVSFVGKVRGHEQGVTADPAEQQRPITHLQLEHYPAMTESALSDICRQAATRWSVLNIRVVHRVGRLAIGEPIVLVEVASAHRREAFQACEFVMDFLKTSAPFWKKAIYSDGGEDWIEQRAKDRSASERWSASS